MENTDRAKTVHPWLTKQKSHEIFRFTASTVDIPTRWDPRAKQSRTVALLTALCAAALFVWLRARYERRLVPAAPLWARLSPLVFGVYWAHPLILAGTARLTGTDWTPGQCLLLQLPATLLLSLLAAWLLSRTPVLRRILM